MPSPTVLVTGATGYVGGRLVPVLLEKGYHVRCLARDPARLSGRSWSDVVEIVRGDALDRASLHGAFDGIEVAYYLIHSLGAGKDRFARRDLQAAGNFGSAAREAGVKRIIYLGGLKPSDGDPSAHLQSRLETGEALRRSGVPVTEFRAAVVIGSGSLSFELIRYLTERVPVMICPRWVETRTQPIAIRDVLDYLAAALETPASTGRIIDIGGRDYEDLFLLYARARGFKRVVIKVPVLTPGLSSAWISLVTPLPASTGRILIEGLKNEVVVRDDGALRMFDLEPMGCAAAIERALDRYDRGDVETRWSGAFSSSSRQEEAESLTDEEGMIIERRQEVVDAPPEAVFRVIKSLGGQTGWLYANALWKLRGFLDVLVGGVGYRRGRRSSTELYPGEAVDFWRVEAIEPDRLLRLRAEMKVPGKAWLQFEIEPEGAAASCLTQAAFFEPRGLSGLLYWYLLYPTHRVIFRGMLREIALRSGPRGGLGAVTAPAEPTTPSSSSPQQACHTTTTSSS